MADRARLLEVLASAGLPEKPDRVYAMCDDYMPEFLVVVRLIGDGGNVCAASQVLLDSLRFIKMGYAAELALKRARLPLEHEVPTPCGDAFSAWILAVGYWQFLRQRLLERGVSAALHKEIEEFDIVEPLRR